MAKVQNLTSNFLSWCSSSLLTSDCFLRTCSSSLGLATHWVVFCIFPAGKATGTLASLCPEPLSDPCTPTLHQGFLSQRRAPPPLHPWPKPDTWESFSPHIQGVLKLPSSFHIPLTLAPIGPPLEAWGGAVSPQNSHVIFFLKFTLAHFSLPLTVFLVVPTAHKLNSRLRNWSKQASSEMTLCLFLLPSFAFQSHPSPSTCNTPSSTTQAMFLVFDKILPHLMARENLSASLCMNVLFPMWLAPSCHSVFSLHVTGILISQRPFWPLMESS